MNGIESTKLDRIMTSYDEDKIGPTALNFCRDFIRGSCSRENCRFIHEVPPKACLKELFRFCHDFQNKGCFRVNCKFIHSSAEDEENFYFSGKFPHDPRNFPLCPAVIRGGCTNHDCKFMHPPDRNGNEMVAARKAPQLSYSRALYNRDDDSPPEAKFRRFAYEDNGIDNQVMPPTNTCSNCDSLEYKVRLLHENISVLLKKVADLTEKNVQLTSMNEFLLEQTASIRGEQPCVITSRHCTTAPVSLATVSVTPVVSLAGALPTLVPTGGNPNLTLGPAASRAQLLTPAPQILTVSTTQQLMTGNSGALIVTSAGAQQLMQVSDSGALMGGGQTVVAVTPAQLTLAPPTQQLVQQSASQYAAQQSVQHLAAAQQSAQHLAAAQQSAQHLAAAQQSAQHLAAAQQSAQHLVAAQQSAQHLAAAQQAAHQSAQAQHLAQQSAQHMAAAAQQSAQQMAAQQSAQQQLVPSAQQLVHQTSTQQITISSSSQPMALANSQARPITFPMISQSILPH